MTDLSSTCTFPFLSYLPLLSISAQRYANGIRFSPSVTWKTSCSVLLGMDLCLARLYLPSSFSLYMVLEWALTNRSELVTEFRSTMVIETFVVGLIVTNDDFIEVDLLYLCKSYHPFSFKAIHIFC